MSDKKKESSLLIRLSFFDVCSKGFWLFFDNLGLFLALSLMWFILSLFIIPMPAATAALIYMSDRISFGESVGVKDFFRAFKKYFLASTLGFLALAFISFLSLIGFLFYGFQFGILGKIIAAFMGCIFIINMIASLYIFPLCFRIKNPAAVIKGAVTLGICHPAFSVMLLVFLILLFLAGVATGGGIVLVTPGLSAAVISSAIRELSYKYGFSEIPRKQERTLKETFFPWKE
ncbi:DUF624 domain-containing protein [bacterium]|jgi:uncharacterized membrane protein YesL|nr:DUF624 domain-containing protein [bacterium]